MLLITDFCGLHIDSIGENLTNLMAGFSI